MEVFLSEPFFVEGQVEQRQGENHEEKAGKGIGVNENGENSSAIDSCQIGVLELGGNLLFDGPSGLFKANGELVQTKQCHNGSRDEEAFDNPPLLSGGLKGVDYDEIE